jgi:NADH:ubiquinone oxidoreductase subunit F (NADH-binding)
MTLPRLLRGIGTLAMSYHEHRDLHGDLPSLSSRATGLDSPLLSELARSGLRGRGGGGFPLTSKLEAVQRARGGAVVVVNGCEGEPMSIKDRVLLESLPHLVIDGAICCARALATRDIVIAIDESSVEAREAIRRALRERPDLRRGAARLRIAAVPSGYVTGQESAIVNFLNDGAAKPLQVPPRITERGVDRRPTLMSNAETLAHVALIVRHGSAWFRQLGPSDEPGSALLTVSGAVAQPAVYEIEYGSSLRSLLAAAGGLTEPARAFLLGGYAGTWVDGKADTSLALARSSLRPIHASLGSGIVVVLPESACPVAETTRVASWMAEESAGQCGPCSNGLSAIAGALRDISEGVGGPSALNDIRRWTELVRGRGACAHPDGAAHFVTSALAVFAEEFEDHARHGLCDACDRPPVLFTPRYLAAVN